MGLIFTIIVTLIFGVIIGTLFHVKGSSRISPKSGKSKEHKKYI
jgi:hypothetical protein